MDILRFITAGNIDDGKSTLIGRLLFDTGNLKQDVSDSIVNIETNNANLAFITDGLRSEREQGITIDVAYKYFYTSERKYIIIDAPGHLQYTKNLVTGASGADAMIILIDACNGVTEQTRRHALIASFLSIRNIVVAINKMDAVNYEETVFNTIKKNFQNTADSLLLDSVIYVPISALIGDNVFVNSDKIAWYSGDTIMHYLNKFQPPLMPDNIFRFPVQIVSFSNGMYICLGTVVSGIVSVGDVVEISPEKGKAKVINITIGFFDSETAKAGDFACLYLSTINPVEVGDVISHAIDLPICSHEIEAKICWLEETPLNTEMDYYLQINSKDTLCRISIIKHKINPESFHEEDNKTQVSINEFAKVTITTNDMMSFDPFSLIPSTGRAILINTETFYTCAAVIIE